MVARFASTLLMLLVSSVSAFTLPNAAFVTSSSTPKSHDEIKTQLNMAAESEVSFDKLDGTDIRIGIIRTRWNSEHVTNLVNGIKSSITTECNVTDDNIFETEVPGSFELPFAARLLALSGTVDAIICVGVLIKGETMHFEYICDTVSSGIMNVGLQTTIPCIFGVLTCLNEKQVIDRSSGDSNHGRDWGKTAVEMALLRSEAFGMKKPSGKLGEMGFADPTPLNIGDKKKDRVGFF